MRIRLSLMALLGAGMLAWPAFAQEPEKSAEKPADEAPASDSAMKQKLLDNFDTNKDGTLDRSEAREIGRALRESFDIGPPPGGRGPEGRRRPDGPPPGEGRGPEGRRGRGRGPDDGPGDRGPGRGDGRGPDGRGPEGRGPGGPDGPPRPPRPERLFNRFDENQDGSLSKDEFMELSDFMRERFPMGPPMAGRGGPGRGFGGPPPRGDFERRGGGEGRRRGDRGDGPPGPPEGDTPKDGEEAPI